MSIYAYVGMPGSGKTYDVVANQIVPALKAGRTVVTNIPLVHDEVRKIAPQGVVRDFPVDQLAQTPELIDQYAVPGAVVCIDEVWRLWPAGQKANHVPEPFRKLLAEHRHMVDEAGNSMQIVLVTQDLAQISAFARQLVEQTFYHTKLTAVGASGSYRVDIYQGPVAGANPPRQSRIREMFGRYSAGVFKLYISHTMSASGKAGANEAAVDGRGNIWKRPMVYVAMLGVVTALLWGGRTAMAFFHRGHEQDKGASGASGATAAAPSPGILSGISQFPLSGAPRGGEHQAEVWRVSAVVRTEDPSGSVAWLSNGLVTVQMPLSDCQVSRFDVACPRAGSYWGRQGVRRGAPVEPVGAYTVADGGGPGGRP